MSWIMVGRKTGREEKARLVKKNIKAVMVWITSNLFNPRVRDDLEVCERRRKRAMRFCLVVRYGAVEGESGMRCHAITATSTLGNPSSRKSNLHDAIGECFPNVIIAHANVLAKDVANGAADTKYPVLNASSSLL
ncbi:hypothetical protein HYALB_00012640 [Hymenoscyphus albidus]|uniref:Uncharacterized protein n=1 Tax=Hymenoscyphus albidus TaxID=595503 RepID=A0A9N9LUE9_9HELO|nr:hypothetical protein HYALB_00012640 [Hymenoscyphus albidus]